MNPFETLEASLRGCHPRPPSPRVRKALFESRAPARYRLPARSAPIQLWIAPLTATALVILTVATAWSPAGVQGSDHLSIASLPGACDAGVAPIERNAPPLPNFRSTNAGAFASSFGSLLLRQTNFLAR
jgi:hypothetical protein